jgi:predicted amidophosphoribosyltransferase
METEVTAMAKLGRNQPCPCGSRRKVKHCCGTERGPSPQVLAWQCLHEQARKFVPILRGHDHYQIDRLLERVIQLPVDHLCLQVRLPRIAPPELERLRTHVYEHADDIVDAVQEAATAIDGPHLRLTLAAEAASLCQHHQIDIEQLAVIIVDLARPTSLFVCASLIAATAVQLGRCPTPAGLLVAAS